MKIIKMLCLVSLILSVACAKRQNSSELYPITTPENKVEPIASPCSITFTNQMNLKEVAMTALKIKEVCNLSENDIEKMAAQF